MNKIIIKQETDRQEERLQFLNKRVGQKDLELSSLKEEIKSQIDDSKIKISLFEKNINHLKENQVKIEDLVKKEDDKLTNLKTEKVLSQDILDAINKNIEVKEKELTDLENEIAEKETYFETIGNSIVLQKESINKLEIETNELHDNNINIETKNSKESERLSVFDESIKARENKLKDRETDIEKNESDFKEKEDKNILEEERLKEVSQRLNDNKVEVETLKTNTHLKANELDILKASIDNRETSVILKETDLAERLEKLDVKEKDFLFREANLEQDKKLAKLQIKKYNVSLIEK